MKFAKRTLSVLLALLMLAMVIPVSVYAATLKISTQPKTSYTADGSTAKATIKASGDGLKYTWYFKNAGASKFSKSSITSSTYSTKMSDTTKNRQVYCVVKDKKGKTVKSSTATLRMKATITTQPKTAYAQKDKTVSTVVKAKGDGLKYTWYIKNAGTSSFKKSSITKSTYSTKMADICKNRQVYCVVTDKWGKTAKSSTVTLRMAATITTEPKNMSAENGKKVTASLKAVGDGLKYQWYMKNAGASKFTKSSITKSTYTTTMSDASKGRQIYCVVTDKYGKTDTSKTVTLSMKQQPLTITTQPKDVTCKVGDIATFTVQVAGGKTPYTYRWQCYCDGDGDFWWDIEADMEWAGGYNTPSLGIKVSPADFIDVTMYRCVITDAVGNQVVSNEVEVIEAESPLTITMQPEDITCRVGDEAGFGVVVKGGTAPYTYRWEYTVTMMDGWQAVPEDAIYITGDMVSAVLPVAQSHFDFDFRIRCVITDAKGAQVTTNEAGLIQAFDELAFNVPPQTVTASVGDEVSFYPIVEGGKLPYTYQWQIKGALGTEYVDLEEGQYQGVTEDYFHFVVNDFEFDNGHTYRVIVTDANGTQLISDPVWVEKAEDPLTIVTQPQNVTAKVDDTVSFSVAVSGGTEPYAYQWQSQIGSFDWGDISGNLTSGEQTERLSVIVNPYQFGTYKYRCVITDAAGNQIISDEVWVEKAKEPLVLLIDPVDVYAKVGDTVSFTVGVCGGEAPYTYRWEYMAHNFSWTDVTGWTNGADATLSFDVASNEFTSGYQYRCVITDADGETLTTNAVSVKPMMSIVTQPQSGYAAVGEEHTFFVEVENGKGPYTYQWQYQYVTSGNNYSRWLNCSGQNYSQLPLTVDRTIFSNHYRYRCVITDATDTMVITDVVEVKEALRIWIQPANTVKEIGSTATFQVAVTGGAEPYSYQWQFIRDGLSEWRNVGTWATGGTGNTMSFQVEGASEWDYNHQYRCVITDAAGNQIISDAAWVVDANALRITSQPVNDYGRHGQQNTFTVQVAGGTGPYTYQWQWSDYSQPWRDLTNNAYYSGVKTNILDVIVMEADFDYETKYRCIITDAQGNQVITDAVWSIEY